MSIGPKPQRPRKEPDFKAIANELFDYLFDLHLAIMEGDPRMHDLVEKSSQLLDRVESDVKDK